MADNTSEVSHSPLCLRSVIVASIPCNTCQSCLITYGDTQVPSFAKAAPSAQAGEKIVMKTDLLFEAQGFGDFKPPAIAGVRQDGKGREGLGGQVLARRGIAEL